jgi:hypothetical protein
MEFLDYLSKDQVTKGYRAPRRFSSNQLRNENELNNTEDFGSYLKHDSHINYEINSASGVQENYRRLLWEPIETNKYSLGEMSSIF